MAHEGLYGIGNKKIRKGSVLSIIGAIILLIIITLIFNYFNFIPLSKSFPALFGFLPHETKIEQEQQKEKEAYEELPLLFACPVAKDLCTNGAILYDLNTQSFNGFGYTTLPAGTKIVSPFAGNATIEKSEEEGVDVVRVAIESVDNAYEAIYTFQGTTTLPENGSIVSQGEVVGSAGSTPLQFVPFTQQTYILYSIIQDSTSDTPLPLKPAFDGLGLTLQ